MPSVLSFCSLSTLRLPSPFSFAGDSLAGVRWCSFVRSLLGVLHGSRDQGSISRRGRRDVAVWFVLFNSPANNEHSTNRFTLLFPQASSLGNLQDGHLPPSILLALEGTRTLERSSMWNANDGLLLLLDIRFNLDSVDIRLVHCI